MHHGVFTDCLQKPRVQFVLAAQPRIEQRHQCCNEKTSQIHVTHDVTGFIYSCFNIYLFSFSGVYCSRTGIKFMKCFRCFPNPANASQLFVFNSHFSPTNTRKGAFFFSALLQCQMLFGLPPIHAHMHRSGTSDFSLPIDSWQY